MKNKWQLPTIKRTFCVPDWLIAYRRRPPVKPGVGATHFFLDDFRFEAIWNNPEGSLKHLKTKIVLSPDFSIYREWPLVLQLWNSYRNRWCGAFWQSKGYSVIPTVSWAGPNSYDFCFAGIEPGGIVAIGTVGVTDIAQTIAFRAGFREMIQRLKPQHILCYGPFPKNIDTLIDITTYPSFWKKKGH